MFKVGDKVIVCKTDKHTKGLIRKGMVGIVVNRWSDTSVDVRFRVPSKYKPYYVRKDCRTWIVKEENLKKLGKGEY